jgi:hypothetical protein
LAQRDRALQVQDENIADFPIEMFESHSVDLIALPALCQIHGHLRTGVYCAQGCEDEPLRRFSCPE